jgi:hypothetical protein
MSRLLRCFVWAGIGVLASTSASWSQPTEADMKAFPMPPAQGYAISGTAQIGGAQASSVWFTLPPVSSPNEGSGPSDFTYVRITGLAGNTVQVSGKWGSTPIPPPSTGPDGRVRDSCYHSHSTFGVWGKITYPGVNRVKWVFVGGGGKVGQRTESGECVVSTTNDPDFAVQFGWGTESIVLDFSNPTLFTFTELVVGVLSNTHGWGSCQDPDGFVACTEPSWVGWFSQKTI